SKSNRISINNGKASLERLKANGAAGKFASKCSQRLTEEDNEAKGAFDEYDHDDELCARKHGLYSRFVNLRRYLNPFLCLVNILLIITDFSTDILIARYHFMNENYIATSITLCFIYWAAYMHFLFDGNFHRKLLMLKRKFNFRLNNICTDLVIGIVYLLMPLKNFIESIYLVYNMYRWELRLINCRDRRRHQDIEVMLRMSLRKAHKSSLILALFEAFPQFL